jgi:uncharacterized membrane protein YqjE
MPSADRSIASVLHDIVGNLQDIIRSELRLARTEIRDEISKAGSAGLFIGAAVLMLAFAMAFALLAIFFVLREYLPPWAAALIVAVGEAVIGALLISSGLKRFKALRAVPKTVATVKENIEWAKQPTK